MVLKRFLDEALLASRMDELFPDRNLDYLSSAQTLLRKKS
jgi:hypothetical protein